MAALTTIDYVNGEVDPTTTGTVKTIDSLITSLTDGTQKSKIVNSDGSTGVDFPTAGQKAAAASTPTVLASDQPLLSVVQDTTKIGGGSAGTLLTPVRALISASSSGNNNILSAAGSGNKIRVLAYSLINIGGSSVTAIFKSDGASGNTSISGKKLLPQSGSGIVQGFNVLGWFETAANKTLDINLSGANEVSGEFLYVVTT